eukprot:SAG31_NODE_7777_length_1599_cov_1.472667_1_plen_163_part_10
MLQPEVRPLLLAENGVGDEVPASRPHQMRGHFEAGRKFCVRAYVVARERLVFAYERFEVRTAPATWSTLGDTKLCAQLTNGAAGGERSLLDEHPTLESIAARMPAFVAEIVGHLRPAMFIDGPDRCEKRHKDFHPVSLCLAALDIMVGADGRLWLLEVNAKNP